MNLISDIDTAQAGIELKYCERCGGLFLRLIGASLVYCGPCKAHQAGLHSPAKLPVPLEGRTRRKARLPQLQRKASGLGARINDLKAVASAGVLAC
jgi:hypothetical protein